MSTHTPQWGFEKPAATTQNKTAVYNADLDRLDEGRRLKVVAGTTLGANLLTYVSSGRLLRLATGANRPLAGFVSSSGTAVTTVSSGADVYTQVEGHIINSAWAFTPGLPVYAHPSAAGSITQTVPGSLAWPIAYAISSHQVAILPGGLHETHPNPEIFAGLIITGTASVRGNVRVQSLFTTRSAIVTVVASAGEVIASSRMATRHWETTTPTGGISGEIAVTSGQVYANDAGTWRPWSTIGTSFQWGAGTGASNLATAGTEWFAASGAAASRATEAASEVTPAGAVDLSKLRVDLTVAPGEGTSHIFTVRKNGADTDAIVTISDAALWGVWAGIVSYAGGDRISIQHTVVGVPATGQARFGLRLRETAA